MNRLSRTVASAAVSAVLVGAGAPAAMAAPNHAPTVKVEVSVKADATDKGKGADKGKPEKSKPKSDKTSKKVKGQRTAALQVLKALDKQFVKAAQVIDRSYADTDAQVALLANVTVDRAALVTIKADLAVADTVAEVREAKADLLALHASNYKVAVDLLEWAADNAEYVDGEPGYEAALAKADEAVALLVTVNASTDKGVLIEAEVLLEESDAILDAVDESIYDETDDEDEFEDE